MEIDRRTALTWGAAGAVGVIGSLAQAPAAAADDLPLVQFPESFPELAPPTPGLSYLVVSMFDFIPFGSTNLVLSFPGVYADPSGSLYAPMRLPPGSRVREINVFVRTRTSAAALSAKPRLEVAIVDQGRFNIGIDIDFVASPDIQTGTETIDRTVQHGQQLYLGVGSSGGIDGQVVGALIGYEPAPAAPPFTPISPLRVYDSRLDMSPDANGLLASGDNRSLSIADGRDLVTGAVNASDVVPAGAAAIAYNLAVVDTTGRGFLTVASGGAASAEAASINWGTSNSGAIANAAIVQIDTERRIKLFAGGNGSTHAIIDVTGYFMT